MEMNTFFEQGEMRANSTTEWRVPRGLVDDDVEDDDNDDDDEKRAPHPADTGDRIKAKWVVAPTRHLKKLIWDPKFDKMQRRV